MTSTPLSDFVQARTRAEQERNDQQRQAVRTVAGNARDRTDFTALLSMLGLDLPARQPATLNGRLATYVRQVAAVLGVPAEATGYEVTDTATAYLGLDQRWASRPDHDLMLVWDERLGWYIALETTPTEAPVVLAYLDGDTVPPPTAVAQFATDTTDDQHARRIRPVRPSIDRAALSAKIAAVC